MADSKNGNEIITLKGDRKIWMEFAIVVKRQKKTIWDVLKPLIESKIEKNNQR